MYRQPVKEFTSTRKYRSPLDYHATDTSATGPTTYDILHGIRFLTENILVLI